jgi:hypothetical protein
MLFPLIHMLTWYLGFIQAVIQHHHMLKCQEAAVAETMKEYFVRQAQHMLSKLINLGLYDVVGEAKVHLIPWPILDDFVA